MNRPKKLRSKKAGLPPGALVHIGEIKTDAPGYSVLDYDAGGIAETTLPDAGKLTRHGIGHANRWANVYGVPNTEDLAAIGMTFSLHPLVQEDILNNAQRQKVDAYDDYLYIVLHRYELADSALELSQDQISLVLGRDFLLSFQERSTQTFEPVRQRLRNNHASLRKFGVDMLAYALIDAVVDSYFALIERLNEHAESLEAAILGAPRPAVLENIHQLKRCVSQLRRNLYPLRELLGNLHRDSDEFFDPEIQIYLRDVHDHSIHILESLDDLRELSTSLLDVYLSTVSHRVNLEVRALTVVATIFMPATLIAGIFGMNFQKMPWLQDTQGFDYAIGLMVAIAVFMLAMFWRRRFV